MPKYDLKVFYKQLDGWLNTAEQRIQQQSAVVTPTPRLAGLLNNVLNPQQNLEPQPPPVENESMELLKGFQELEKSL